VVRKQSTAETNKIQPGSAAKSAASRRSATSRKRHAPTIRDVAALANVSIATVSNVLDAKDTLYAPSTAEKVLAAVKTLGYRPNHSARSLVRRRTHTLGFAAHWRADLFNNFYLSRILSGFLDYARHHDYQIKIIYIDEQEAERSMARLADGSVDGIALLTLTDDSPFTKWAENSWLPTVSVGNLVEAPLSYVGVDDFTPFYEATQWLLELGHRRIGLIGGPLQQRSARDRERAYRQAMTDAGLNPAKSWVFAGHEYVPLAGHKGAQQLLKVEPALTAFMCGSDLIAMGALEALRDADKRVPEDVSLIGFDDINEACLTQPPLTTIRQPIVEIGAKAAEVLLNQIVNEGRDPVRIAFPGTLIKRASVATIKKSTSAGINSFKTAE